jgi:transposase-like protein
MSVLKGELTQSEIARRMERSQTTISKWLKLVGHGTCQLGMLKAWPQAHGL